MNKYQEALDTLVKYAHESPNLKWVLIHEENIIQELVDKETPVKPEYISLLTNPPQNRTRCGNCKGAHLEKVFKFCPYCGQKIDWSSEDE